jgi:hypothetical protein
MFNPNDSGVAQKQPRESLLAYYFKKSLLSEN